MEKTSVSRYAFVNLRVLLLLALLTGSIVVALVAATVDGRTRRGGANPIGFRLGPAMAKSAEIKTSSKAPAGSSPMVLAKAASSGKPSLRSFVC